MNLRIRLHRAAALALLPLLALTACGSGDTDGTAPAGAQAAPKDDPVADVRTVDSIAALLPADVRKTGTLRVGSSVGFPPGAYYPNGTDKDPEGQDIDIADAVAKVLGLELQRQDASFETILPALGSGKYDVGTGNFGVTANASRPSTSSPTSTTARVSPSARATPSSARRRSPTWSSCAA